MTPEHSRASTGNGDPRAPRPEWSRPGEALALFTRGATARAAWRVALLVGTILSLINQGGVLASGEASTGTWIRVALNYCVPFIVASWGFLAACRVPREP